MMVMMVMMVLILLILGLSDVASILARRVALEVSDSDEGPSDSEYDSDEWGEALPSYFLSLPFTDVMLPYLVFSECLTRSIKCCVASPVGFGPF